MILSASRRTDIPCYYSEWLVNRLRAGYVITKNPFNNSQLSRIPLSNEVVDCIVFWTKDAKNILPHLPEIDWMGYNYYFQFTITPYDNTLEPNLRDKREIEDTFITLSNRIGKERVHWRYDPIVVNDTLTVSWHKEQFESACERLAGFTNGVTISFVDSYKKLKTPLVRELSPDEMASLAEFIGSTAKRYGIKADACCEGIDLRRYGINRASCVDRAVIEKICGCPLEIKADKNQRAGCGCVESIDIGMYNTCLNGCIYCYANNSEATTKNRYDRHNPRGDMLIGELLEEDRDRVVEKQLSSNKQTQTRLSF